MFWNKTVYEPKVGDRVIRWFNCSGLEATRIQRKPYTAILKDTKEIKEITQFAYRFDGEDFIEKNYYFLEIVT